MSTYKSRAEEAIEWKARDIRTEALVISDGRTHNHMGQAIDRVQVAELILEDAQQLVDMIKAEEARKTALPANAERLGRTQLSMLDTLTRHSDWHRSAGWVWTTVLQTEKILDNLVARKLVDRYEANGGLGRSYTRYVINDAGRAAVEAAKAARA